MLLIVGLSIFLSLKLIESKTIILHNAKFDLQVLKKAGIILDKIYDTMLAECVLYCGIENYGYGLDKLVKRYIDIDLSKKRLEVSSLK